MQIHRNIYTSHKVKELWFKISTFYKWTFIVSTLRLFFLAFCSEKIINNNKLKQLSTHLWLLPCIKYRNAIITRNAIMPEKYTDLFIYILQPCHPKFRWSSTNSCAQALKKVLDMRISRWTKHGGVVFVAGILLISRTILFECSYPLRMAQKFLCNTSFLQNSFFETSCFSLFSISALIVLPL